ncbi:hypothetical protein CCP2SC5_80003 [Azospirillaceae bacterium]
MLRGREGNRRRGDIIASGERQVLKLKGSEQLGTQFLDPFYFQRWFYTPFG